jgi:Ankyrin repeats (3 copies)
MSVDRAESSSDDSSSPTRNRPGMQKFSSLDQDNMSPAKVVGTRKWRDKNGRTFLSRACNNDDLEKAKICHHERPEDLNLPDNAGNTPLQIAALEGFGDIVKFLLEKGAEVDTRNIDKETRTPRCREASP